MCWGGGGARVSPPRLGLRFKHGVTPLDKLRFLIADPDSAPAKVHWRSKKSFGGGLMI